MFVCVCALSARPHLCLEALVGTSLCLCGCMLRGVVYVFWSRVRVCVCAEIMDKAKHLYRTYFELDSEEGTGMAPQQTADSSRFTFPTFPASGGAAANPFFSGGGGGM